MSLDATFTILFSHIDIIANSVIVAEFAAIICWLWCVRRDILRVALNSNSR